MSKVNLVKVLRDKCAKCLAQKSSKTSVVDTVQVVPAQGLELHETVNVCLKQLYGTLIIRIMSVKS